MRVTPGQITERHCHPNCDEVVLVLAGKGELELDGSRYELGADDCRVIKRLQAVGNSSGVIIDRPILDLLKITNDTQLEVITEGERLTITPLSAKGGVRKIKVSKARTKTLAKHAETFRKLAK